MNNKIIYPVLSVAGSDCSGGAGIQADIKSISANGCYAMAVITSITAQNTTGVSAVEGVSPQMVAAQVDMVCRDIFPLAVKTGMLYSKEIVSAVSESFARNKIKNLVVDPVMISTSGSRLIADDAIDEMVNRLFPLATVVTPNKLESEALTGLTNPVAQAEKLLELGCTAVLVKGGDRDTPGMKTDIYADANGVKELSLPEIITANTHGTGCTLSAAIASNLAKGQSVFDAVRLAKDYIFKAIKSGANHQIGHGHGPVDHFWNCKCS